MKSFLLTCLSILAFYPSYGKKYYAAKMETFTYLGNFLDKSSSRDTVVIVKIKHKKVFINGVSYRRLSEGKTSFHTTEGSICRVTHTSNPKQIVVSLEGRATIIRHFIIDPSRQK